MAITPYRDLSSEDILAAHVSGLQHSVNKIELVLDMKTSQTTGHQLRPVDDQDDPSLRFRIYEGSIRGWLEEPEPIIYRNGSVVDPNDYVISPAHGVVVFHQQQASTDEITADFTHITAGSSVIENLQSGINQNTALLANNPGGTFHFYPISGSYLTHFRRDYNPFHSDGSVNVETHIPSFNVLVYGNTIDAFPFPVTTKTRFKQAAMSLSYASSTVNVKIGIYQDNGSMRPGRLLYESPTITIPAEGGWGYADVNWELEPGFYWIARHDGTTAYWNGLAQQSVINLVSFNAVTFLRDLAERPNPHTYYGGYRATNIPFGNMPDPYPASGELFQRAHYCSPWLVVE